MALIVFASFTLDFPCGMRRFRFDGLITFEQCKSRLSKSIRGSQSMNLKIATHTQISNLLVAIFGTP